jgi:signal transduction histidine kinase
MASHEFRTPLTTILSSLVLISKYAAAGLHEKEKKHIERIKTTVTGLSEMLNDFLSVSKLEEGKVVVAPERLQIKEVVAEVIEDMQTITKQGQLLHYVHTGQTEAILDKKLLRHILLNLISNAIKFSPENSEVWIFTLASADMLSLRIEDTGMGISEEDQVHLYERFFRGQNATNIQGTGLGLNIVANYLKIIGGNISLSSSIGKGTVFKVEIPYTPL